MSKYLDMRNWSYLSKNIEINNATRQQSGTWRISAGITRPRHVFVIIINSATIGDQTANPFLYSTFSVSTDPRTLSPCHLDAGNGNEYWEQHYQPSTEKKKSLSRCLEVCSRQQ